MNGSVRGLNLFASLRGYDRRWLVRDLVAGLTVWAVLVPEGLAYAGIAGVTPVVGLYAAVPALLLYAVFGSSRHLVVGPMAATAALSAAAIAGLATDADALALTAGLALVVGVLGLAAGVLRLGFVASFISEPVLKGFIIGLALTIIIGQVPKLVGVEGGEGAFFEKAWHLLGELGDVHGTTVAVGVASLAIVVLLRRFVPRAPAPLVAVVVGIALVGALGLDDRGVAIVGHIDSGLPSLGLPDMGWTDYGALVSAAAGVLLVAFGEGLAAARTYAQRDHYPIDPDRELVGIGAANIGSGLSSGMVVAGSLSKTAVNGAAGAASQLSGLVVSALTVVTLLFLTGLFENLPEATLAAVVIAAVVELVDVEALRRLFRLYSAELGRIYGVAARADLIAALAALLGVLVFDTLPGLFIGIAVSALLMVYRASRPHVAVLGWAVDDGRWVDIDRHPDAGPEEGILVVRPESGLFYANADNVRAAVEREVAAGTWGVVVDLGEVPVIDVSAVGMLVELADDLDRRHVALRFARDIGQVRDMLVAAGAGSLVERTHPTVAAAIAHLRARGEG